MDRFEIIKGDITKKKVDVIVCGSDYSLLSGGAVFNAIHRISGKELTEACKAIKGCPIGKAKMTEAYELPAKKVIHTAIPMWEGGESNEKKFLGTCYKNSLILASRNSLRTIVFPVLGIGHYNYPRETAFNIAFAEIHKFLHDNKSIKKVSLIAYNDEIYQDCKERYAEFLKE